MPTRLACDRCHAQKLRCIKNDTRSSCNRCFAAGAQCKFSPSMRGMRPQKAKSPQNRTSHSLNNNHGSSTEVMDSTAFLSNSPLPIAFLTSEDTGYPQLSPNADDVGLHEPAVGNYDILVSGMNVFDDVVGGNMANINADFRMTPTASSSRRHTPNLSGRREGAILALERSFAQLSQRLCEHALKIIPLSILLNHRKPMHDDAGAGTACGSPEGIDFHIEDTFSLTEAAISMGKQFTDIIRQHRQPSTTIPPSSSPSSSLLGLSVSSLYLLLSCHHRLLDIWSHTFAAIHNCARASRENPPNSTATSLFRVPKVSLGSFTPSTSTTLALHLSLMVQCATELEAGIRALVDEICLLQSGTSSSSKTTPPSASSSSSSSSTTNGRGPGHVDAGLFSTSAISSCRALLDRAGEMVMGVEAIKLLIKQTDVSVSEFSQCSDGDVSYNSVNLERLFLGTFSG